MIRRVLFFAVLLLLASCNRSGKFSISGNITDANGEMLYFEKNGLLKDSLIDSVKLNANGNFKFKTKSPKYPELYRLKVKDQKLILGVDSIENILVKGSAKQLINAKITNSQQSNQIQNLRKKVLALQLDFDKIGKEPNAQKKVALRDTFQTHLDFHRREVLDMILNNPLSMASYFSLYQQISDNFIFNPYEKEDLKYYRAVATSFQTKMPEYERTKNIYNLVLSAIKENRKARQQVDWSKLEVNEISGFVDIELKDKNGYPQKLSTFSGKPILLDFFAYESEARVEHTFELRDLHKKYSSQGLQIFQVSIDQNKMFWQKNVSNVPWTAVFDETGNTAQLYNIRQIPTLFLIDKKGTIIGRYTSMSALKADLSKAL